MKKSSSELTSRLDSLGSRERQDAVDREWPFTGSRPSALITFEGQRLDSARHVQAYGPKRDASSMPATEEIVAATAHELRLPLSHIKGFVTSLRRTDVEWDDATQKEFLAEIDVEADRLADILESMLAAAAPDRGYKPVIKLVFTEPASIVHCALHRVRGLFGDRLLRIDVPPTMPSIRADPSQMERVLANLIENAIKYSPASTAISISARITEDAELEFTVDDEGPGIPAADRERIFEPFFRNLVAERSKVSGHGLGLAICRSIVLAHGGHIEVGDRPGGGARIRVFLPARMQARQGNSNSQPKEQGNDPATDSAKNSGGRRRGAHAQVSLQQPQAERLRRPVRCGWSGGVETLRGAPVRPAVA
jgi:signal transduction histidine kinase